MKLILESDDKAGLEVLALGLYIWNRQKPLKNITKRTKQVIIKDMRMRLSE